MPDKNIKLSIGGSVESAMKGDYSIDVKSVLTEAWQKTLKSRMSINIALFGVFLFGMIISYVASSFFGGIERVFDDPEALQIINVVVTIAVWPFLAGIEMMGVLHAIGRTTKSNMALSFLHRGSWVALCALLTSLLVSIGLIFLYVPGIILAALLSLTIPLVVEKKLSPTQAIVLSVKSLRFSVLRLLTIYAVLIMSLVFLLLPFVLLIESTLAPVGIVAFLFGLSYIAPWYYNVKGILYREIFGVIIVGKASDMVVEISVKEASESNDTDDTFSA